MKILQLARYGSVKGGAETYVRTVCEGLREAGHTVVLAYGTEPDDSWDEVRDGFHLPLLAEPGGHPPPGRARALREVVETFAPDLVHVHVPDVTWVAPYVQTLAPALLAVHDHRLNCPAGTKYWAAWRRACTVRPGPWCLGYNVVAHCGSLRANATLRPYSSWQSARGAGREVPIQVFSEFMRLQISRAGVDERRIGVTPYPVPAVGEPEPIDEPDARPVVLASGRLNKEKGFHQLIEAMRYVGIASHLVLAGAGHERTALEQRAASSPGPHRITFTGWLSPRALAGWYRRASVVAVPSMWPEPFGIVGLEAMAHARPVVAFDSGGIREWLVDGRNGRLVPGGDVEALGRALDGLVRDPDACRSMGEAGRARAETEFSLVSHIERLIRLYETVRRARGQAV